MKIVVFALLLCFVSGLFAQDFTTNHGPSVGYGNVKEQPKDYPPLKSNVKIGGKNGVDGVSLVTSVKKVPSITPALFGSPRDSCLKRINEHHFWGLRLV